MDLPIYSYLILEHGVLRELIMMKQVILLISLQFSFKFVLRVVDINERVSIFRQKSDASLICTDSKRYTVIQYLSKPDRIGLEVNIHILAIEWKVFFIQTFYCRKTSQWGLDISSKTQLRPRSYRRNKINMNIMADYNIQKHDYYTQWNAVPVVTVGATVSSISPTFNMNAKIKQI